MRFFSCFLCTAILFQTALLSETIDKARHSSAKSYDVWVSENGSDSNSGSHHSPFLTLHRARSAVRRLPARAFRHHDVTVYIRGGTYRLDKTLTLKPKDSGRCGHAVIWRAAPGEHPRICGSMKVTGWSPYDESAQYISRVCRTVPVAPAVCQWETCGKSANDALSCRLSPLLD